jgi:hypothetical protein
MQRKNILFLLSILIITSLACSFGFLDSFINSLPEEVGDVISDPGRIATLVLEEAEALSDQESPSGDNATAPINDLGYGLSELESFQIELVQSLDGVDQAGNPIILTVTNTQEIIKPLQIFHLILRSETAIETSQFFEVYRFGNEVYLIDSDQNTGEIACTAFTEDLEAFNASEIDAGLSLIFSDLSVGEKVEEGVLVNDILTDHYLVNDLKMANSNLENANGEIWFAQNGGYIVRFEGIATGESVSVVEGVQGSGTIKWTFNLSEVNQITEITLPKTCSLMAEGGINDIPVPEDAMEVTKIGSMLSFSTSQEPAELAEYYRLEMANSAYQLKEEIVYEDFYAYTFEKAEETVTIILALGKSGGSEATIIIEEK